LSKFPDSVTDLASVTNIDLSNNQFRETPSAIAACEQLETLLLFRNQIDHIGDLFDRLGSLYSLQMQENQLTTIPVSIGKLENLSYTIWTSNQIVSVPDELTTLTQLKHLQLNNNQIKTSNTWELVVTMWVTKPLRCSKK